MTRNMRPCPFCQSINVKPRRHLDDKWYHLIDCLTCGAQGPTLSEANYPTYDIGEGAAIDAWNART